MFIRLVIIVTLNSLALFVPVRGELDGNEFITLKGRVTSQGTGVAGATVEAKNIQTDFSKTTTTDDQGFYRFENLPLGRYAVVVSQAGFAQMKGQIDLAVHKSTGLNFRFEVGGGAFLTGMVEGKVTDEAKKGIADARVKIVEEGTSLFQRVTTDAEGNYEITDLSPGRYRIVVEASGYKDPGVKLISVKEEKAKTQDFRLKNQ